MEHDFWHQRWQNDDIGFHKPETHPLLDQAWDRLRVASDAPVLVPLCGKSLDLIWLRRRGHPVIGIELSEVAVEAFVEEHQLELERVETAWGYRLAGEGFSLLVGDIFAITAFDVGRCGAVYDRAALVALPPVMRLRYAHQLARIMIPGTPMLVIVFQFDRPTAEGPPFSVSEQEVVELFPEFQVRCVAERTVTLAERPVRELALSLEPR